MNLTDYNEITALLKRHGFRFSKSMGQNFLTADWVPSEIADASLVTPDEGVLEVGPGIGCLTEQLARRAGKVVSVELDKSLKPVLAETLADYENVSVVFQDALKTDLAALCREKLGDRPWRVCANLPYNVTSPLLTAFMEAGCFESITVMIQREVAQRLCAVPGTADYGAFTVLVDWYTEPEKLFDVPPHCFVPRPKVTSSVVRLNRRKEKPAAVTDEKFFFRVVRSAFGQRRKTLPNALCAGLHELDRGTVLSAMEEVGLLPQTRGETLSILQFADLSNSILCKLDK